MDEPQPKRRRKIQIADEDKSTLTEFFKDCIYRGEAIYMGMLREKLSKEKYLEFMSKGYSDKVLTDFIRSKKRTYVRRISRGLQYPYDPSVLMLDGKAILDKM